MSLVFFGEELSEFIHSIVIQFEFERSNCCEAAEPKFFDALVNYPEDVKKGMLVLEVIPQWCPEFIKTCVYPVHSPCLYFTS